MFALIEQPHYGWSSPVIAVPLLGASPSFVVFLAYERRAAEPMLELELFSHRNFAVGNLETLSMYAGIAILFFYLTIYLQEVAGYSALESGLTTLPVTIVMFALSRRFGALADRYGPRLFMGAGPLVAAAGILLLARLRDERLLPHRPPARRCSSSRVGLSAHGRPAHRTVLADADEHDAGIASAVNNAVARVAGLIGVSLVGIVVAGTLVGDTFAANSESVQAFPSRHDDLRRPPGRRGRDRRDRDHESAPDGEGGAVPRRPARRGTAARRRKPKRGRGRDDVTNRVPLTGTLQHGDDRPTGVLS